MQSDNLTIWDTGGISYSKYREVLNKGILKVLRKPYLFILGSNAWKTPLRSSHFRSTLPSKERAQLLLQPNCFNLTSLLQSKFSLLSQVFCPLSPLNPITLSLIARGPEGEWLSTPMVRGGFASVWAPGSPALPAVPSLLPPPRPGHPAAWDFSSQPKRPCTPSAQGFGDRRRSIAVPCYSKRRQWKPWLI